MENEKMLLKFGKGNAKLGKEVYTFSLPASWTCPNALDCLAKANRETGKITDGPDMVFRCYAASQEALYPNVRKMRWHNFEALKNSVDMYALILASLPDDATIVRIHVAGDFFNKKYFNAWLRVAKKCKHIKFYFYTKMLSFLADKENFPKNFIYTASLGGKQDALIELYDLRTVQVVYSEDEANELGLEIDHDDSHAMKQDGNFALLIHGIQPKGSDAARAKNELKGKGSYPHRKPLKIYTPDDTMSSGGK